MPLVQIGQKPDPEAIAKSLTPPQRLALREGVKPDSNPRVFRALFARGLIQTDLSLTPLGEEVIGFIRDS